MDVYLASCKNFFRRAHGEAAQPKLHPVWLRFFDAGEEDGFVQHCTERLQRNMFVGVCYFTIFCLLGMASVPSWFEPKSVQILMYSFFALEFAVAVLCLLFLRVPMIQRRLSPRGFEALGLSFSALFFGLALAFHTYWKMLLRLGQVGDAYLTYSFGNTNESLAQARADSTIIMYICIWIASAHCAVPFRFCILLVLDVATLCAYPASVAASGTWQGTIHWRHSGSLALIIGLALLGKRHTEHTERVLFSKYLKEKTLRVTTEFQLDTQKQHPAYSSSNAAFQCIGSTGDVQEDLKGVLELGRREHWLIESENLCMLPGEVLGQGGFGKVCAARFHGTPVAVKTGVRAHSKSLTALGSELRVLRRLRHPHIVAFHGAVLLQDLEAQDGVPQFGIVLERVFGPDLASFVQTAQTAKGFVLIAVDISRALQYMHSQTPQVLHTDLKPSNIMVETSCRHGSVWPRAKLIDFGLARVLDPAGTWGQRGGTRAWMAPEQFASIKATSAASDMFALGGVVRFMETGKSPRSAGDAPEEAQATSDADPRWGDATRPFLSDESRAMTLQCLSGTPGNRPKNVRLVREQLEANMPQEESTDWSTLAITMSSSVDTEVELGMLDDFWDKAANRLR